MRRTKPLAAALAVTLCLAPAAHAPAQEIAFVIRHAEKADGADPALTPRGRDQAAAWAAMLTGAGIDAIVTSEARRTRETGAIIGAALSIEPSEVPASDRAGLLDLLTFDHAEDRVLVVGHAETIPGILNAMNVAGPGAIAEGDFGNLFVVTHPGEETARLVHLRLP